MPPAKSLRLLCFICALAIFAISGCAGSGDSQIVPTLNQNAAVVGELPVNPLQWRIITSTIDKSSSTMSTLFGNDLAVDYARAHAQRDYPDGSVLVLVTWTEREDPRWFGAKIPDRVSSVELLTIGSTPDGRASYSYTNYTGAPLKKSSSQQSATPGGRAAFLLSLRSAVLP